MRTATILPVKRFSLAKQRLGASVADTLRLELARAMVADVLLALADTECNEITIVVTREESVAQAAAELGALVLDDVAEAGQSAAAELGVRQAIASGIERVLCVPGDCPALDPLELDALLGASSGGDERGAGEPEVVIIPDRHGTGTNGLLLSPPSGPRAAIVIGRSRWRPASPAACSGLHLCCWTSTPAPTSPRCARCRSPSDRGANARSRPTRAPSSRAPHARARSG
jgi:2-phospho-L-lactate guanylyltransferase